MPITFFTHCRAFEGEFDQLQRRAIESWRDAVPGCQIILMGSERGVMEAAADIGVVHKQGVPLNEYGTPLVCGIFWLGEVLATNDLLCEISADIVLMPDFWPAVEALSDIKKPFVIGQRYDVGPGKFADRTELHSPYGIDYFIYRKGTIGQIPPFAIGRTVYDNWLVWAAMELWDLTVVDATEAITALHINHSYPEYGDKEKMLQSAERDENLRLSKETGCDRWGTITDAPYVLNNGKILSRELA